MTAIEIAFVVGALVMLEMAAELLIKAWKRPMRIRRPRHQLRDMWEQWR